MPPNKQAGNMYGDIDSTWNLIKGSCLYKCSYCSIEAMRQRYNSDPVKLRLDEKELRITPKPGKYFIGSSLDMWHPDIPSDWIMKVLYRLRQLNYNYIFQSKNPESFLVWIDYFPTNTELCTTIETNRKYSQMGNAPDIVDRIEAIKKLGEMGFYTTITIEPIMDFDFDIFARMLYEAKPHKIYIGADSQKSELKEPSKEKVKKLIKYLNFAKMNKKDIWDFEIVLKDNLMRLTNKGI